MVDHEHPSHAHTDLPPYLEGLTIPATTEDALEYAEQRGASPKALAYIETLPAAVFTTEQGMRHAFSHFNEDEVPYIDPDAVLVGEDGTSS